MKLIFSFILVLFLCSSCATLYTRSNTFIHFSSNPQDAEILIDGEVVAHTPQTVKVKRSLKKKTIEIRKDGYLLESFEMDKKFKALSLLSTTFIFVDLISGSIVDYRDNFIHRELIHDSGRKGDIEGYNLSDNFYVITNHDTIYTQPFQDFDTRNFFSNRLDKMNFRLIDGTMKSVLADDIYMYKTLELYRKSLGMYFLSFQTQINYNIKKYIRAKYYEGRKIHKYMFMECLLTNNNCHLLRSLVDVLYIDHASYNAPVFYLYKEGEVVEKIKRSDLLKTVEDHFSEETELIAMLKEKKKFKTIEQYVYQERRRADRYYVPF